MRLTHPIVLVAATLAFTPNASAQEADRIPDFAIELFGKLLERLGPEAERLQQEMGDLSGYHLPEILPNGDILIRKRERKDGLPPPKDGEIDL